MRYGVEFVGDEAMPEGRDFVLIQGGGRTRLFYRASAVRPELICDGWAALHAVAPDLLEAATFHESRRAAS